MTISVSDSVYMPKSYAISSSLIQNGISVGIREKKGLEKSEGYDKFHDSWASQVTFTDYFHSELIIFMIDIPSSITSLP